MACEPLDPESYVERPRPRVRARTISIKRLSKRELERGRMLYPEAILERPATRRDCLHGPHAERPCPFVGCKHHLFLDVNERTGSIKLNFPDLEVWELPETCTLDIADRGGVILETVGEVMNLTQERVRQLETRGLAKLKSLGQLAALRDDFDPVAALDGMKPAADHRHHLPVLSAPATEEVFDLAGPSGMEEELGAVGMVWP